MNVNEDILKALKINTEAAEILALENRAVADGLFQLLKEMHNDFASEAIRKVFGWNGYFEIKSLISHGIDLSGVYYFDTYLNIVSLDKSLTPWVMVEPVKWTKAGTRQKNAITQSFSLNYLLANAKACKLIKPAKKAITKKMPDTITDKPPANQTVKQG